MTALVAVVGSCNLDHVASVSTLPRPGETVLAASYAAVPGGKGLNQAIAAARAGARCAIVAAVGDDPAAGPIRAALRDAGVDLAGVRTQPGPSGTALIAVDGAGENTIVVASGANRTLTALTDADGALLDAADVLLLQLEIPLEMVIAAAVRCRGLRLLNAAPARALPRELLAAVDLLVVNELEASALAGGHSQIDALLGLVGRIVVTMGPQGARYADRDGRRLYLAAPPVIAVDTTAAGDTFTGVLGTGLAEGQTVDVALELACAAASLCVETAGASTSIPLRPAIDARWRSSYGQGP